MMKRYMEGELAPDAPKGATQAQKDKAKKDKETVTQIAKEVKEKREKAIKDEAEETGKTKEDVRAEEEADTLAFNTGGLASKPKPKPKKVPTFQQFLDQVGKGKFKGGAEAHAAYQKEFGSQIPGAGMGAGGKAGVPGSSSGKHSKMSNAMKEQEAKNKKKP